MKLSPSVFAAVIGLSLMPVGASAQNFAGTVVSSSGLRSGSTFSDPSAVLGQPTTLDDDTFGDPVYHASMVNPAFGVDANTGKNLLAAFSPNSPGQITVQMSAPITHSGTSWYGQDFTVFSNTGFASSGFVDDTTDMSQYHIGNGTTFGTLPQISVSADGNTFYNVVSSDSVLFPENPYHWAGMSSASPSGWGNLNDFSKPIAPTLTAADFAGQTVAYADNTLYNGSAGGTSYSFFGQTPLTTIDFIRFSSVSTGSGGVIDGVAAVGSAAPVPEASSLISTGIMLVLGLGAFAVSAKRRKTQKLPR